MELILEFIFSLFIEGSIEVGLNKKISKWIRYPLLAICILFYVLVIALLFYLGIMLSKQNALLSLLIHCVTLFLAIFSVRAFIKKYHELNNKKEVK